ncbi:MAG: hypothetical protein ABW252_05925 [Polyangiales bacterium]
MSITFDMPGIAAALERASAAELDALSFGVVRLSDAGVVVTYSKAEGALSGFDPRRAVGRSFFDAVAPCMNTPAFRGRIEDEGKRGTLDIEFGHTGDFSDPGRFIRVRVCAATGGGFWLLLER